MKTKNIIQGLQILLPYYNDPNGLHTEAQHDILYADATDIALNNEEINKLIELGWSQEKNSDTEFRLGDYEESWYVFT